MPTGPANGTLAWYEGLPRGFSYSSTLKSERGNRRPHSPSTQSASDARASLIKSTLNITPDGTVKSRSSEKRYVSKKHFFRQVPPLKTHCER